MKKVVFIISLIVKLFLIGWTQISYGASALPHELNQKTLQGQAYNHLKGFVNSYSKLEFVKIVKIADLTRYRQALQDVQIVINPSLTPKASYHPNGNILYLSQDPGDPRNADSDSLGESIWHELTHKIENDHGDIGWFDSQAYAERNVEYMTYIVTRALLILRGMELKASDSSSDAQSIKNYWNKFILELDKANQLPEVKAYPADLALMEKWFGFKVNKDELFEFYRSGKAGKKDSVSFNRSGN